MKKWMGFPKFPLQLEGGCAMQPGVLFSIAVWALYLQIPFYCHFLQSISAIALINIGANKDSYA
jgi:hypothetical protein